MNRRVVTGVATAAATGLLAVGLAAERSAMARLRGRVESEPGAPFGQVLGTTATVRTDDGLSLYAEIDDGPSAAGDLTPYPFTTVFIHGYANSHDAWHYQRAALQRRGRVVSYDHRSHGRSDRAPAHACTIAACGADLVCVLDQLVPDGPVVLVGHSMGGMAIMSFAEREPEMFTERVAGVVLASTSSGGLGDYTFGLRGLPGRLVSRLTPAMVAVAVRVPMLIERSRRADNDLSLLIANQYSFASAVPADRVQFMAQMLAQTPIEVVADFFPTFFHHDGHGGLARMHHLPVQIIGAAQDRFTPVEHAREIAASLPEASYAELDPSGHILMIEHPRRVTELILDLADRAAAVAAADSDPDASVDASTEASTGVGA